MVHPRRTPWTTVDEFARTHDLAFSPSATHDSQLAAVDTISVWISRGNCPHPAESTAALLDLVLRDHHAHSSSDLRLAYAMALVRFVNSLVDPLQTTYFARSIASLAQQIHLPLAFVELRHQATHEDLPPLAALRDAARQALDWLYTHYWSPALLSSSSSSNTVSAPLPPLPLAPLRSLLLTTYKALSKSTVRDASLVGRTRAEVRAVLGEVDAWVRDNSLGGGRDRALEGVAEVLWSEGGLVPLAKKKRPTARAKSLSTDLVALWTPLIAHLDSLPSPSSSSTTTTFSDILVRRGIEIVCASAADGAAADLDKSYVACVCAWVVELLRDAPVSQDDDADEGEGDEEAGSGPTTLKGVVKTCLVAQTPAALGLVETLFASRSTSASSSSDDDPALADLIARVTPLVALARLSHHHHHHQHHATIVESAGDASRVVDEMARRAEELEARLAPAIPAPALAPGPLLVPTPGDKEEEGGEGAWPTRVKGWTKRPIGSLPRVGGGGGGGRGSFEALELPPLVVSPAS